MLMFVVNRYAFSNSSSIYTKRIDCRSITRLNFSLILSLSSQYALHPTPPPMDNICTSVAVQSMRHKRCSAKKTDLLNGKEKIHIWAVPPASSLLSRSCPMAKRRNDRVRWTLLAFSPAEQLGFFFYCLRCSFTLYLVLCCLWPNTFATQPLLFPITTLPTTAASM